MAINGTIIDLDAKAITSGKAGGWSNQSIVTAPSGDIYSVALQTNGDIEVYKSIDSGSSYTLIETIVASHNTWVSLELDASENVLIATSTLVTLNNYTIKLYSNSSGSFTLARTQAVTVATNGEPKPIILKNRYNTTRLVLLYITSAGLNLTYSDDEGTNWSTPIVSTVINSGKYLDAGTNPINGEVCVTNIKGSLTCPIYKFNYDTTYNFTDNVVLTSKSGTEIKAIVRVVSTSLYYVVGTYADGTFHIGKTDGAVDILIGNFTDATIVDDSVTGFTDGNSDLTVVYSKTDGKVYSIKYDYSTNTLGTEQEVTEGENPVCETVSNTSYTRLAFMV